MFISGKHVEGILMEEKEEQMKPIWYFVGLILLIIGLIVLVAGIYYLFVPAHHTVELSGLHIDIWWGMVLIIGGGVLIYFNNKNNNK